MISVKLIIENRKYAKPTQLLTEICFTTPFLLFRRL